MRYAYTCQCTHPQTWKTGCWLYMGDDHKTGATLSPVFSDLGGLFDWMRANGWESIPGGIWTARKVQSRSFDVVQ